MPAAQICLISEICREITFSSEQVPPNLIGTVADEWALEGWGVSQSSAEFRLRALECYRWAQEAVGPRRKKPWLIMAQLWLDRAESAERDDRQNGAPNGQEPKE
jgi:hypothetical protein